MEQIMDLLLELMILILAINVTLITIVIAISQLVIIMVILKINLVTQRFVVRQVAINLKSSTMKYFSLDINDTKYFINLVYGKKIM